MTTATQSNRPALIQAIIDAFKLSDLRSRILFTLFILVVFRFFAHVPVPGVDKEALQSAFDANPLLGFIDIFSGGALRNMSIAALGVYPYITASIIIQILTPLLPQLKELAQEGEAGRKAINRYTHYLTVPLAFLQGYGQINLFSGALGQGALSNVGFGGGNSLNTLAILLSMTAGTMILVWLGELVTEKGIGNGISLIIFSIVVFTEAQRRIPVQYGRSVFRGNRMYRSQGSSHIPIRVNSAGMIPLIFAFSILALPAVVASYFVDPASNDFFPSLAQWVTIQFGPTGTLYWVTIFILVVMFTFFYTLVVHNQQNLAEQLQNNNGFIPGIRPGPPTKEYLMRVILRITWGGAIFLGIIAVIPSIAAFVTGLESTTSILQSTSLLIMVGVALDTMRQLESQLLMRNYEGFVN